MADNSKNYIGLLDSGVGGLSVLRALYNIAPDKNYIFFGDTKNIPYGTKNKEQILSYTKNILEFFVKQNVKYVAIACNTTSALAYSELNQIFKDKLKIFPLIQTCAAPALQGLNDNDTIAVFATRATVNSGKYEETLKAKNPKINVISIDCTGFVEIVENRKYDDIDSINLIKEKIDIVKKARAKRVVLGCTHYPYLVNIFKKFYDTDYFDPAINLANIVKNEIKDDAKGSDIKFFVSKDPDSFILSAKTFFEVKEAKLIDLD